MPVPDVIAVLFIFSLDTRLVDREIRVCDRNCTFITLGGTWWDYLDRWATGDNEFAATLRKGRAVLAQSHTDPDTGREYRDDYIGIFAVRNLDMTPIGLSLEINPQRLANVKRGRTTAPTASSSRPGSSRPLPPLPLLLSRASRSTLPRA
jgi:hypothetical protein